jgi:hypothetical protein
MGRGVCWEGWWRRVDGEERVLGGMGRGVCWEGEQKGSVRRVTYLSSPTHFE